jgi:multiple sugar transport system permease protein
MKTRTRAAVISAVKQSILFIISLTVIFPLLWMISAAFKPLAEVFAFPVKWIPSEFHPENFILPFRQRPFLTFFMNSIIVSVAVTLTNLIFASLAAYGIAKYSFRGRKVVMIFILSVMMLPIEVRVVPQYLIVRSLGFLDSLWALILPNAVYALSFFIMHQYFITLPSEYIEAARMDGYSELRIVFRIIFPISIGAISAMLIFTFTGIWNDYLWPLVAVSSEKMRTLPLGLAMFQNSYQTLYNQVMAISLLSALPIVVMFLCMQKKFISSMVMTGIKG